MNPQPRRREFIESPLGAAFGVIVALAGTYWFVKAIADSIHEYGFFGLFPPFIILHMFELLFSALGYVFHALGCMFGKC